MKAIIFDADGMVIEGERFSSRYKKEFNITDEEMSPFFEGVFRDCSIGKADLKGAVEPFLKKWKWEGSIDDFLDYWFSGNSVNEEMVREIKQLKNLGIKCYLATNQEKYRTEYFKKEMGLEKIFDKIYSSAEIGHKKSSREFFQFILDDLKNKEGVSLEETIYWDDKEENIALAKEMGLEGYIYKNIDDFRKIIENRIK